MGRLARHYNLEIDGVVESGTDKFYKRFQKENGPLVLMVDVAVQQEKS